MKKLILLFLLSLTFSNVVISQSNEEALSFLRANCNDWGMEKLAKGTIELRLRFDVIDSFLLIKEYTPQAYYPMECFYIYIKLSSIVNVENDNGVIKIYTAENGIRGFIKEHSKTKLDPYDFSRFGWTYDGIRLAKDVNQLERANRIIKAISFLAINNGATIKKSSF